MSEQISFPQNDPKGYKALVLEWRDSHFWLPGGVMFEPDFEVVAKSEAIALFVEYERTFGRGKAFEITHQTTAESRSLEVLSKYGGHSVVTEFEKFAYLVPIVTRSGEAAIANRIIGELKDFRRKYPLLYEDADQHPTAGHPY